jgi:Ni,Fe-hydrogenase I small subunit
MSHTPFLPPEPAAPRRPGVAALPGGPAFSRREVLRLIALTATASAAVAATGTLTRVLAQAPERSPILWLNQGGGDLNLLAQLGRQNPELLELVSLQWDLSQWDALLPVGFTPPAAAPSAAPIVILESYPPRDAPPSPAHAAVQEAVEQAKAVILLGTDACYGGVRLSREDVKDLEALCRRGKTPLIKLPGIPVPVQHLVGTLAYLQFSGFPRLDSELRPELYYSTVVCTHCERRADLEAGRYAAGWGERGCLLRLGCKGPLTHNSCSQVRWNGGENWCVGAGGSCTGCAEPGFPDHGGLGLYGRVPGDALAPRSPWLQFGDWLGKAVLGTAAAGVALHLVRRWWAPGADRPGSAPRRPGEGGR